MENRRQDAAPTEGGHAVNGQGWKPDPSEYAGGGVPYGDGAGVGYGQEREGIAGGPGPQPAETERPAFPPSLLEKLPKDAGDLHRVVRPSLTYLQDAWIKIRKNKAALISLLVLCLYVGLAVFAPILSPYDYAAQNAKERNQWPSAQHWFGTDQAGRDLWTRNWEGARISLFIGFVVVVINTAIGSLVGGISGYFGGKTDMVLMRIIDVLYGIPMTILAVLMMVVLSKGLHTIILAMVAVGWIGSARMARGQVLSMKNAEYVLAAQQLGAGSGRIILKHFIPNMSGILITTMTMAIPSVIFTESFLSYIGIGVQAPACSWGSLAQAANQNFEIYPYQLLIPSVFICTTVLAFNMLGDGLRDALDPRMRGEYKG